MKGRVLVVAGSDSGGGAGIQADIKTIAALGGYAATAVTALTAQDTHGVHGVSPVAPEFVAQQMKLTLEDIGADCVKTGMLVSAAVVTAVSDVLDASDPVPLVVDPVMAAKSGSPLLEVSARQALKARLVLRATVLTPNLPEAEILTGMTIGSFEEMRHAGEMLLSLGPRYVLLKGGHMPGPVVRDLLVHESGVIELVFPRIDSTNTHGTGCTLASGIAAGISQGLDVPAAVERARAYVQEAIRTAPGYGAGFGPLNHGHTVKPFGP
jgi:hydroxymethylpyrimidine/phosphomethylpyrimidine kinase